ncbi:MAG: hypothetical protein KAH57_02965 [Thermoplasmata archaeon]|nr:hypothetical protein [Thermoplasmata archaeon]
MHSGDIPFRFGLIMAAMLLLGMFGGELARMADRNDDIILGGISNSIREAADLLLSGPGDTTLTVDLGMGANGSAISLPPRLDGEAYSIHVLPDLLYLKGGGEREISLQGVTLIPSFPPVNGRVANLTALREMGRRAGGFTVETPCVLYLSKVEVDGQPVLFIHPGPVSQCTLLDGERIRELIHIVDGDPPPLEGHLGELNLIIKQGAALFPGYMLLDPLGVPTSEGWCPVPIILPAGTIYPDRYENELSDGDELFICHRIVEEVNGTSSVVLVLV